jgi:hypothetical protein
MYGEIQEFIEARRSGRVGTSHIGAGHCTGYKGWTLKSEAEVSQFPRVWPRCKV